MERSEKQQMKIARKSDINDSGRMVTLVANTNGLNNT